MDSTSTGQNATFPNGGYVVSATGLTKPNGKPLLDKSGNQEFANYGGSLTSTVKIDNTAQTASFTSGVAARGGAPIDEGTTPGASATSTAGVNLKITNNGSNAITLNSINSDIIQAGMGFMVQKTKGNAVGSNVFTGYGVDTQGSFADLNAKGALNGQVIATSSFSFDIYGQGYIRTPDITPLYQITGSVSLGFDSEGNVYETYTLDDPNGVLTSFTPVYSSPGSISNSDNIAGFQWDETGITVDLDQLLLGAGDSTHLYYRATSSVQISAPCVSDTECLVAYSGFGDPVGRGGGTDAFDAFSRSSNNSNSSNCPDDDSQICFSPQGIAPFSNLNFTDGGVPEPAAWALMILGFGLTGAALRRRRVLSYS